MQSKKDYRWLRYLIYLVVIAAFVAIFAVLYFNVFLSAQQSAIRNSTMQYGLLSTCFIFGLLLGAEHLIHEINKKKSPWQFNLPRFILCGVPALLVSLISPFSLLFDNLFIRNFLLAFPYLTVISAILFGYILISNFSRKKVSVNKEMAKA